MKSLIAPQTYKRTNNFDLIRLILAFMVAFYHINKLYRGEAGWLISHLTGFAISAFFVISGLLITWSFDKDSNLVDYSMKRFFRIYPLYFVVIVIQMCIMLILVSGIFNTKLLVSCVKYLVYNITFLNFLQPTILGVFENLKYNVINGSLWTIKIEVLFYILLPLIYYAFKKLGIGFLIFLYSLSAMFSIVVVSDPALSVSPYQFLIQLKFFIVGIIFYLYGHRIKFSLPYVLLILVILFIVNYFCVGNIIYKAIIYPVCLGFIVYLIGFSKPIFNLKYDISYGVYIIHFPLIQLLLFYHYSVGNFYLFMFTALVTIVLLALLSFVFLEKKFIGLGHRLSKRRLSLIGNQIV